MHRLITGLIIQLSLLLPPLLAVWLAGDAPLLYLDFPFRIPPGQHAAFSWPIWWSMVIFVLIVSIPFVTHALSFPVKRESSRSTRGFPVWGIGALILLVPFWILAWTRFPWFADMQVYTFTPLWLCYIMIINAITTRRKGDCLLIKQPLFMCSLYILSSIFWWYYEFLNGFIQNWYYVGIEELSTTAYVLHSSIAYGTVLPAVISTIELLNTYPRLAQPLRTFHSLRISNPGSWAITGWGLGSIVLGLAAVYPEQLFMCVWIAPLFVILGLRYTLGHATVFSSVALGDWRPLILPAMAALICGFFWEMWNSHSLAHWEYNIPYVENFYLFEMPVIGYGGYLPFGLVCLAVGEILSDVNRIFE